jgi:colanic acid/amylovoran biosynthesis protein
MLIEIRKAGFVNKGAELMLHAVHAELSKAYPDADFAIAPHQRSAPYIKRAEFGTYQKAQYWRKGVSLSWLANLIPGRLRRAFGIVLDKELDVVVDIAGFSYSDQWGGGSAMELAGSCKRWKKNGTKVIMMPQAFGPFGNTRIKKSMRKVAERADLIFARDEVSYKYLTEVAGERSNIKLAPDFTNLIQGIPPADFDCENHRVCLVPNYRMIDKTKSPQREAYLPFMIKCAQYLLDKGAKPFILVHEGADDLKLANQINDGVTGDVPVLTETHPLKIKGILSTCDATIGSRFHGLVSALSQGVPALATGWSHKYQMLFENYSFPEGVLDVCCDDAELRKKLDLIVDEASRSAIQKNVEQRAAEQKQASRAMWDDVFAVLKR